MSPTFSPSFLLGNFFFGPCSTHTVFGRGGLNFYFSGLVVGWWWINSEGPTSKKDPLNYPGGGLSPLLIAMVGSLDLALCVCIPQQCSPRNTLVEQAVELKEKEDGWKHFFFLSFPCHIKLHIFCVVLKFSFPLPPETNTT